MDPRVQKTKEKLHTALLSLLERRALDEITVSQLCERADVNRSTFYVYYGNVTDCFYEIADALIERMQKKLLQSPGYNYSTYLKGYFQTARANQTVFRVLHSVGIQNPMIHKMISLYSEAFGEDMYLPVHNENLAFSFLFSGFYGMVAAWLADGCKESDEELIQTIRQVFPSAPI